MRYLKRMPQSLLAAIFLLLSLSAAGAQPPGSAAEPGASPVDTAEVIVNGRPVFRVLGISSYPAKLRAENVAARIESVASDAAFDPASLAFSVREDRTQIMAGEKNLIAVFDVDAQLEGIQRQLLAEVFAEKIRDAIRDYRHDREPGVILSRVFYALVASAIFIGLLWGIIVLFRWIGSVLERRVKKHIESLEVKSVQIFQAQQIWSAVTTAVAGAKTLTILVLVYIYLSSVLGLFPWTRILAHGLLGVVVAPLLTMGRAFVDYLPKLVFLILLVFIARYLLKLIKVFFEAIGDGRVRFARFEAEWAKPTYSIVRFVFIAFTLVIAYPYIPGSDSDAFKGVSLFLGVLFSLGSSSVLSNVMAGYTMTYRRAFKVGDRIRIGDVFGDVAEMSVLVTHVTTPKNERVVIPNSKILNTEVVNYTRMAREQGLILHTNVGIGYETPWRQVEAMLLMAAERTPGLKPDSQPFVLQKSLGDFAVNYELNVFCDDARRMNALYTDLHRNIQDVFNEYGVQIMTPAYENDTPQPKLVPKDQWYTAPAKAPDPK